MFGQPATRGVKVGAAPGTLVHIGEQKRETTHLRVMAWDSEHFDEHEVEDAPQCLVVSEGAAVTWINVEGLHDVPLLEQLGECYHLHRLVLEDVLDTGHRPKIEDYEDYLYFVGRYFWLDERGELKTEQLSLILGQGLVITFCEGEHDILEPVRQRIREGSGRLRRLGADYLAYAILDALVDSYFVAIDQLGQSIEDLETELITEPDQDTLRQINRAKRKVALMRRGAWPLREVMSRLEHAGGRLVTDDTSIFIRDVYDHIIQIADTLETFRDMLSSMFDTYLSSVSNRMNEVMKVLTIIATIFIPITFIAGVYGMNFQFMPELAVPWAYPVVLAVMLSAAVGMLLYFRRRRWL